MHRIRRFLILCPCLALLILLNLPAQDRVPPRVQLPRDADKLIARAQDFWSYLLENQKAKALEFVVEADRDAFLSGQALRLVTARVTGVDLSANPNDAVVRTSVRSLTGATPTAWELSNRWIRKGTTWYVQVGDPKVGLGSLLNGNPFSSQAAASDRNLDADLKVPEIFDIGTVIKGRPAKIKFPVEYAGKMAFTVESTPRSFVYTVSEPLSLETHSFNFYVIPDSPEGDFALPLRLTFYGDVVKLERKVIVKGKVFSPLTFRQVPPGPVKAGELVKLFVVNNTSQTVIIKNISVDLDGTVLKWPDLLRPNEEAEILYQPLSGTSPERLDIVLAESVFDMANFSHTFRKTP